MTNTYSSGLDSIATDLTADSHVTDPVVDAVTALAEQVSDLTDRVTDLEDENEQLRQQLNDHTIRLDALGTGLTNANEQIDELDGQSRDNDPTPQADDTGPTSPETPLEQVVALDEEMAELELTANQQRARFVAKDFREYATSVPAGLSMESGDIRRVLRAGTDCDGRTATVARVIDFLDNLGGDDAHVVKRRGSRQIVMDSELVARLEKVGRSHGCDEPRRVTV